MLLVMMNIITMILRAYKSNPTGELTVPKSLFVTVGTMYSSDTCEVMAVILFKNCDGFVPGCLRIFGWLKELSRVTFDTGPCISTSSTRL